MASPSISYDSSNLWSSGTTQNHRICDWASVFTEWNTNLNLPNCVKIVIDNLKASADPRNTYNPPLTHFLTYFNNEQEGYKWFLYECIALEWFWGSKHMNYIRGIVPLIDIDSEFPNFPGSNNVVTVREFIESHLTEEELESLSIPPKKEAKEESYEYIVPLVSSELPEVELPVLLKEEEEKKYRNSSIEIRFIRSTTNKTNDDKLIIKKISNDIYSVLHRSHLDKIFTITEFSEKDLMDHLSCVFRLVSLDQDPFENIQFSFPNIPTVILPSKLDSSTRDLIYETLSLCFANWP